MQNAVSRDQRNLDSKLIHAVRKDKLALVRQFLAEGANPSAIEVLTRQVLSLGRVKGACDSALITAARRGTPTSHEIIHLLLAAGADVAYVNHWGETVEALVAVQRLQLKEFGGDGLLIDFLLTQLRPAGA